MVGRSLFLHPTTFPPAVLGEVSSSKLQATSQALKPQASSIKPPILKPPASCLKLSCFPWPATSRFSSGFPRTCTSSVSHFPLLEGPSRAASILAKHVDFPCRAGRRGRSQGQGWECSDQWDHAAYRKGNKLLEQFNHNVSGTSAPKAIAASTANVPDGFKILHAQRAAKCARLAEAAAAAAAPATDDA
ncbi:hypothetical protein FB451DRAFT_1188257 [Mycena latifolia]|nr:hypothetical protein FB451DRAFT_1188257 [Mycena latifolia]